jgi:hypothetical protein
MASVSQVDPYGAILSRLASYEGSNIPVPALSRLLGVKTTTLNARFRRRRTPVRKIGRTNYLLRGEALQLVQLHRYALIGWPTLQDASRMTEVKPATLKARCEKGRLEGHIDLTKRLRVNPAELGRPRPDDAKAEARIRPGRLGGATKLPAGRTQARAPEPAEILEGEPWRETEDGEETPEFVERDAEGGLPKPAHLVYDPQRPFSLSVCAPGSAITYGQHVGTILRLIDDPYSPKIKVAFPDHEHPAMREVLLVVDKKLGTNLRPAPSSRV